MTNISLSEDLRNLALSVIEIEAQAITALRDRIDQNFFTACNLLLSCSGRVVVTGMGKSGHIGKKIAATLASTGTPAFFVHPGEASHGDMGMITRQDVVIAISYSGETDEVITLLPLIKRLGIPLICLTSKATSTLGKAATTHLDISVSREACPLDLAPTASTTATLVMGDILAVALLKARGFTAEDFARSHPGGRLGRRLLLLINELMHGDEQLPKVHAHTMLSDALIEITKKKLGMTTIVDNDNKLLGIFTDGDLRRALDKNIDIHTTSIDQVMTHNPRVIFLNTLAAEALQIMENHKITSLVVTNEQHEPIGIIHLHDLLKAGLA